MLRKSLCSLILMLSGLTVSKNIHPQVSEEWLLVNDSSPVGPESEDDENDGVDPAEDAEDDVAGNDGGDVETQTRSNDHEHNVGDEAVGEHEDEEGHGRDHHDGGEGLAEDIGEVVEPADKDRDELWDLCLLPLLSSNKSAVVAWLLLLSIVIGLLMSISTAACLVLSISRALLLSIAGLLISMTIVVACILRRGSRGSWVAFILPWSGLDLVRSHPQKLHQQHSNPGFLSVVLGHS